MAANLAYLAEKPMSPAEFLAWERAAESKHEYADGVIHAMSGASRQHVRITVNVTAGLHQQLRGQTCETFNSDLRVWIPSRRAYNYPDALIVCGEANFLDNQFDTLLNPTVIIEVLSPSSERRDLLTKFRDYRAIPSLMEYIVIAQDERIIYQYVKREDGIWMIQEASEVLRLVSAPCVLTLDEIYERVEFADKTPVHKGGTAAE